MVKFSEKKINVRKFSHECPQECFIGYPNTSNFVKNNLQHVIFSTLFLVKLLVVLLIVVHRMKKAGIACPTVALLKKHILVMSFIGKDQQPAPKLKDAVLSPRQLQLAYEQCVQVPWD